MSLADEKAKLVRLCIFDVDGVLTSGRLYYGPQGMKIRSFHIRDGLGMKLLQKAGIETAIISAKQSEAVEHRMHELGVRHVYLGKEDKLPAYEALKKSLNLQDEQIAYMGDDLPDLPLLSRAGLALTVPEAPAIIKQHVDYTTIKKGGKGAVREVCEWILTVQGHYASMVQSYLAQ